MPTSEYPLRDSIITSLSAQEPWPDNVKLYQPYEVEQILLPDNASCLAVQAFLKMCNLPFEVEMRWNAEYMSPSGRVPLIKCGAFVISELEPIVQFVANKGVSLCTRLSAEDKAEMRAYMSLITNVLVNAELYISWLDEETYNSVTKVRNSSVYPWPLGWIQTRAKRNAVSKRLKALNWYDKTLDQVLADVEQCCNSLSQRLGEKDFFFGSFPTPLDALVYGHLRALLGASGPKTPLMLKGITTALLKLVIRVSKLTDMKLGPQEQYLIKQALQVAYRRPVLLPPRTRFRRSWVQTQTEHRNDNFVIQFKDVADFKPFANKNIAIPTNEKRKKTLDANIITETEAYIINAIIDDLIAKVYDIIEEKMDAEIKDDKRDFEIVAFGKDFDDTFRSGVFDKSDRLSDTLTPPNDENSYFIASPNVDTNDTNDNSDIECIDQEHEEVLHVIDDDDDDGEIVDVVNIVNDDKVVIEKEIAENIGEAEKTAVGEYNGSSKKESFVSCKPVSSGGDQITAKPAVIRRRSASNVLQATGTIRAEVEAKKSDPKVVSSKYNNVKAEKMEVNKMADNKSAAGSMNSNSWFSSESRITLPSDDNMSVDHLLRCLRRRFEVYGKDENSDADVDPTELDALVFGHVFTIITTRLPCKKLAETVRRHETLVALAKRIDEQYFKRP